jgi:protein-tyrosine phosphatase
MRSRPAAIVLWFFSRLNDQCTKLVFTPFVRITPHVLVGPQLNRHGWAYLRRNFGVNSLLNLRVEADDLERGIQPDHYLWLPTIDHTSPTIEQLQKATDFIVERVAAGDGVYIHCAAGVGRAPMTAAAYLVSQGYSVDEAMAIIRSRRPFINQSANQRTRLLQFAEHLYLNGRETHHE